MVGPRDDERLGLTAVGLLVIGTVAYHWFEGWTWVDSLYFRAATRTTVGYGDMSPTTDAAKLFTVPYMLSGVTIIVTYLNAPLLRRRRDRQPSESEPAHEPPDAGEATPIHTLPARPHAAVWDTRLVPSPTAPHGEVARRGCL